MRENCAGIYVNENSPNIMMLLFADDMVNLGDTVGNLQKLIDKLSEYCKKWAMKVNIDKTKVMVFRNGGALRKNEKWYLDGAVIEICTYYKYLGLMMSNRLHWGVATKTLASQANKVLFIIKKLENKCGNIPLEVFCHLFDSMVVPILCYGSEIWGSTKREHRKSP